MATGMMIRHDNNGTGRPLTEMDTAQTGLLDIILPRYQFMETHHIVIRASPAHIMESIRAYRAGHDPLVRMAIGMRELPARLMGKRGGRMLDLDDFTVVGQEGNVEIVFALMGAFWEADYGLVPIPSPEAFAACDHTGICRLAMGFHIRTCPGHPYNRVVTQTRVDCPTHASRRRFAPYWYAIRPVSGLIRRRMLNRIRMMAERA